MNDRVELGAVKQLIADGDPTKALSRLWASIDRGHRGEADFARHLALMSVAYERLGHTRAAGMAQLYLGNFPDAHRLLEGLPGDRARVSVASNNRAQAAQLYKEAGWFGHAAVQMEYAERYDDALLLWEALAAESAVQHDRYVRGLVHFNIARMAQKTGHAEIERRATVASLLSLETAADQFESSGRRERAFDCYQAILTMGLSGAFENLCEGYINCIRILSEDNLKYYVLQYFEDFQAEALKRHEYTAAATLFQEAAEFSRRFNLPYETHYRLRSAEAYKSAADRVAAQGAPVQLSENALKAAIQIYNGLGQYRKIRELYTRLSEMPVAVELATRYASLSSQLQGAIDENLHVTEIPDYLRLDSAYPPIWHLDVIEWENGGDAANTMAEVLLDPKWPDFTRRRALLACLHALEGLEGAGDLSTHGATLAERLGRVEIYDALPPLERLWQTGDNTVQAAVLRAARQLFFKRTFGILISAVARLEDDKAVPGEIRQETMTALRTLHFGHAFDPLQRIYRSTTRPDVRQAALESLARIPSLESVELLVDAMREGTRDERSLVHQLLVRAEHPGTSKLVSEATVLATGSTRAALEAVLRARGRR